MRVNAWTFAPATDRDLDCWDLKDGACSPRSVKSGETLVDARGDTDVQIVRYARFWDERQTEPSGLLEPICAFRLSGELKESGTCRVRPILKL